MTLLMIKMLIANKRGKAKPTRAINKRVAASSTPPNISPLHAVPAKDNSMSDQVDNWHKLARYDTNMQGELHANLLRNNGITVSLQPLSAIPGMNSGVVLWVEVSDLAQAQRILSSVEDDSDGEALLNTMSDAELGIVTDTAINSTNSDNQGGNR